MDRFSMMFIQLLILWGFAYRMVYGGKNSFKQRFLTSSLKNDVATMRLKNRIFNKRIHHPQSMIKYDKPSSSPIRHSHLENRYTHSHIAKETLSIEEQKKIVSFYAKFEDNGKWEFLREVYNPVLSLNCSQQLLENDVYKIFMNQGSVTKYSVPLKERSASQIALQNGNCSDMIIGYKFDELAITLLPKQHKNAVFDIGYPTTILDLERPKSDFAQSLPSNIVELVVKFVTAVYENDCTEIIIAADGSTKTVDRDIELVGAGVFVTGLIRKSALPNATKGFKKVKDALKGLPDHHSMATRVFHTRIIPRPKSASRAAELSASIVAILIAQTFMENWSNRFHRKAFPIVTILSDSKDIVGCLQDAFSFFKMPLNAVSDPLENILYEQAKNLALYRETGYNLRLNAKWFRGHPEKKNLW